MDRQSMLSESSLPVALDVHSFRLTDEQFRQLCQDNEDLRLELTADGELIIMAPTGGSTGARNAEINHQITGWAIEDGTGISFDSSTMFACRMARSALPTQPGSDVKDGKRLRKKNKTALFRSARTSSWNCALRQTGYRRYSKRWKSTSQTVRIWDCCSIPKLNKFMSIARTSPLNGWTTRRR